MIIDPPGKKRANATPSRPRFIGQGRGRGRPRGRRPFRSGARRFGRAFILLPLLIALAIWIGERDWSFLPRETVSGLAYVIDGDSLRIGEVEIRIADIDAPEMRQFCRREGIDYRCGVESRSAMERLVADADVSCVVRETDRFGRSVAHCEANGLDLGSEMVASGHAIAFGAYEAQEARARAAGLGIWAGEFEPPAEWRRAQGGADSENE